MKNAPDHKKVAESAKERNHSSLKSTTSKAQQQRILNVLCSGPKTSYDPRRLGCYQSATRIIELRRMGVDIKMELVDLYERDGYLHARCTQYHRIKEGNA